MNATDLAVLREARDTAAAALQEAETAYREAERQATRRRAFDAFRSGSDCNWCGASGVRTQYVVSGGKPTGERICTDCSRRHQVLRPATFPVREVA